MNPNSNRFSIFFYVLLLLSFPSYVQHPTDSIFPFLFFSLNGIPVQLLFGHWTNFFLILLFRSERSPSNSYLATELKKSFYSDLGTGCTNSSASSCAKQSRRVVTGIASEAILSFLPFLRVLRIICKYSMRMFPEDFFFFFCCNARALLLIILITCIDHIYSLGCKTTLYR